MSDGKPTTVLMIDDHGNPHDIPVDQVEAAEVAGFHTEAPDDARVRLQKELTAEQQGGVAGTAGAIGYGALRGATGGLSDALIGGLGGRQYLAETKEAHPTLSTGSEIVGAIATMGTSLPSGLITKAGARIAATEAGASALTKIGRGFAGGVVEGGLQGLGSGVSELALSDKPLDLEHIASSLSSNMLFGAATGGAVGGAAKGLEIGIGRARKAIDDFKVRGDAADALPDDLATMDVKQLRAARDVEVDTIKAARTAEKETVEQARVVERKAVADELGAHHQAIDAEKAWLATKDSTEGEVRTIGKQLFKANKPLRNMLDNPKYLAEKPEQALRALQAQENAFEQVLRVDGRLRLTFAADESGARAAALDTVPAALERNRALQTRIRDTMADVKLATPDVSPRLQQIDEARELLSAGRPEKTIAEQMLQGAVFSGVAGGVAAIGGDSPLGTLAAIAAPLVGARASKLVAEGVFGRIGGATSAVAKRGARAIDALLSAGQTVSRLAPPLATKTLAAVRFAPEEKATPKKADLATLYHARSSELRSQTMYADDGSVRMRPDARAKVAAKLAPIAAADPLAADQLEAIAARRVEFLSSKLPRRPDIGGMPLSASDRWRPSEMEMRQFARYVAAVEDPIGIVERVADGTVTPSDTEVMRSVYPEMYSDITQQIVSRLPELRTSLPYRQRLALSRFTGEPVDASMHPRILAVLQAAHAQEAGTAGGTQPAKPQPQFGPTGSISKRAESGQTPSQRRAT